ncbi:MAG: hypothetical protein ACI4VF_01505, partial [Lachnospirales bacterium]
MKFKNLICILLSVLIALTSVNSVYLCAEENEVLAEDSADVFEETDEISEVESEIESEIETEIETETEVETETET